MLWTGNEADVWVRCCPTSTGIEKKAVESCVLNIVVALQASGILRTCLTIQEIV